MLELIHEDPQFAKSVLQKCVTKGKLKLLFIDTFATMFYVFEKLALSL